MSRKQRLRKQAELVAKKAAHPKTAAQTGYERTLRYLSIGLGIGIVALAVVLGLWFAQRSDVLGYVGQDRLSRSEVQQIFDSLIQQQQTQGVEIQPNSEEWSLYWDSALETVIQQKLAMEAANQRSLTPTSGEILSTIDQIAKNYNQTVDELRASLSQQGVDLDQAVADQLKQQKLYEEVTRTVTITATEVADTLESQRPTFDQDEQVGLNLLFLSSLRDANGNRSPEDTLKLANDLVGQLRSGASFADIAANYSENPQFKEKKGDLGYINRGAYTSSLGENFEKAAFSIPIGQISEPVELTNGYGILQAYGRKEAYRAKLEDRWNFTFQQIQLDGATAAADTLAGLDAGQDFAELAKTTSTDTTTAQQGGSMGSKDRKALTSWQLNALIPLEFGNHSGIVEADGKFYILQLSTVETISDKIENQLLQNKQRDAWSAFIEEMKLKVKIVTV
jgi:peptidyl-prolyl cis-trans isomerase SurA